MNNNEYQVSILIVDDDSDDRFYNEKEVLSLFGAHRASSINIKSTGSIDEALLLIKEQTFHVILLDRDLGRDSNQEMIDGIDYIPQIMEIQPNTRVLVLTSFTDPKLAVKAMKNGAMDFVNKDADDADTAYRCEKILRALRDSQQEINRLRTPLVTDSNSSEIKYKSKAMKTLDSKLKTLSEVNTTVLLLGDSGLGKTYTAKRLHRFSKEYYEQKNRVFVNININAIPEKLIEAELFGAEEGSYTGAKKRKQGLFEVANNGDIFLDEIGDASLDLQGKLLKVLEEKTFMRIGGKEALKTNARVICATNKDLERLVSKGEFRQDLLARLSTITIDLPKLNERKEDIPQICEEICKSLSAEHKRNLNFESFPAKLKNHFLNGNFNFNIRGIRIDLERLAILLKSKKNGDLIYNGWESLISIDKQSTTAVNEGLSFEEIVEYLSNQIATKDDYKLKTVQTAIEKSTVEKVYHKFNKQTLRARALGISESNTSAKVRKYIEKENKDYI